MRIVDWRTTSRSTRQDRRRAANDVVPTAILRFNIRPKSTDAMERFDGELAPILLAIEPRTGFRPPPWRRTRPPKPVDALELFDLVVTAARNSADHRLETHRRRVHGNNIASCGVPVVDTMGVRGGAIHSPDEYMIVPSLAERAALSALVLEKLADGDPL